MASRPCKGLLLPVGKGTDDIGFKDLNLNECGRAGLQDSLRAEGKGVRVPHIK